MTPEELEELEALEALASGNAEQRHEAAAKLPALIAEVRRLGEEARTFARIAAIDRLFDDAKSWGSWMVTASNERKGLVNRLNCSGYSIPHKHTTDAS